jgi:hypothetical protein
MNARQNLNLEPYNSKKFDVDTYNDRINKDFREMSHRRQKESARKGDRSSSIHNAQESFGNPQMKQLIKGHTMVDNLEEEPVMSKDQEFPRD